MNHWFLPCDPFKEKQFTSDRYCGVLRRPDDRFGSLIQPDRAIAIATVDEMLAAPALRRPGVRMSLIAHHYQEARDLIIIEAT